MEKRENDRLAVPKFLQQLVNTDFRNCEDKKLIDMTVRAKVIVSVYTSQEWLTPFEETMINGFRHYLEKMEEELQKRGVLIVNVAELIEGHEAEIAEVLKEFSLLYLMRLADELGEMTKSSSGNGPFQVLKGLVYEEIARRGGSGGRA